MNKLLYTLITILFACTLASAQVTQLTRYNRDGKKVGYFYGTAGLDSAGVTASNQANALQYWLRARTPYSGASIQKLDMLSSDGDSVLAGVWVAADGMIQFFSQNHLVAKIKTWGEVLNDGASDNSPLLVLQSGATGDSVYMQYTLAGGKLFVSEPISIANKFVSNATSSIWASADTLFFGTGSNGRQALAFGAGPNAVHNALVDSQGTGVYTPMRVALYSDFTGEVHPQRQSYSWFVFSATPDSLKWITTLDHDGTIDSITQRVSGTGSLAVNFVRIRASVRADILSANSTPTTSWASAGTIAIPSASAGDQWEWTIRTNVATITSWDFQFYWHYNGQ
jgi:hypothetical protein